MGHDQVTSATVESTFRELEESAIYQRMCPRARQRNAWSRWLATPEHVTSVAVDAAGEIVGSAAAAGPRPDQPAWDCDRSVRYVLKGYQRQGIGRRVVHEVATPLAHSGHCSMAVSMAVRSLAQNLSSRRFDGAPDARLIEERRRSDGDPTDAALSGWRDMAARRAPA